MTVDRYALDMRSWLIRSLVSLVRFSNNTALILPPEAYQGQTEISPLSTTERLTLRRRRGIGVLKPRPKASVNEATVQQASAQLLDMWQQLPHH